jgi:Domain of unknown function (DUF4190)
MYKSCMSWLLATSLCFAVNTAWGFDTMSSTDECARIVLKSGDTLMVTLLQFNTNEVRYKRCGQPDDPEVRLNKREVQTVIARDGGILYQSKTPLPKPGTPVDPNLEYSSLTILSLILGILSLFSGILWVLAPIFGISAIIFGSIALKQLRQHPDKYKGKALAKAGIITGIIALFGTLLSLIFASLL